MGSALRHIFGLDPLVLEQGNSCAEAVIVFKHHTLSCWFHLQKALLYLSPNYCRLFPPGDGARRALLPSVMESLYRAQGESAPQAGRDLRGFHLT